MKFTTIKEHRDFFQKRGWIEFEELISSDGLKKVNEAIDQALSQRLNLSINLIPQHSDDALFQHGHDLWRSHPSLQKFVTHARFGEIVSQLIGKKPLRIGFDQFYPSLKQEIQSDVPKEQKSYIHLMRKTNSLENISAYQGLACGLMIALGNKGEQEMNQKIIDDENGIDIFPKQSGHIIFFHPSILINWSAICSSSQRYYLIAYAHASAYYRMQAEDPHLYAPKRFGYNFNDKLNDKYHPIIYR